MELDTQLREFLDDFNTRPPLAADVSPYYLRSTFAVNSQPEHRAAMVDDFLVPVNGGQIVCRVYRPTGEGPFPICVFFHGGGFVAGGVESYDYFMHGICQGAHCVVVSVGYRLAPENKFPTCFEDCYAATAWIAEFAELFDGDVSRLAVAGNSSGATLAAGVSLMARDRKGPVIRFQVLMFGVMDMAHSVPTKSREQFSEGYYHAVGDAYVFDNLLCRSDEDKCTPLLSPVMTPDLSGLPQTLVMSNEWDMLRDEDELYAKRLLAAGVQVEYYMAPGVIHNSFVWSEWNKACKERVYDYFVGKLETAFESMAVACAS